MGTQSTRRPASVGIRLGLWLAAVIVVAVALLLCPGVASDAALRASPRAASASAELSVPAGPDTDRRLQAAPALTTLSSSLAVREWSASAAVDVVASGGSAVNLPADLRVTAVGWRADDAGPVADGAIPVTVGGASAERFGLADGDTLAVTGTQGTLRLRVAGTSPEGPDAALLDRAAGDAASTGLVLGVPAADLSHFSAPASVGLQFTLPDDPSAGAAGSTAERLESLPSDLGQQGTAPEGVTLTGDLPSVLTEVAASHRMTQNLALNGLVLVALLGAVAGVHLRRGPRETVTGLPFGRLVVAASIGTAGLALVLPHLMDSGDLPPLSVAPAVVVSVGSLLVAALLVRVAAAVRRRRDARSWEPESPVPGTTGRTLQRSIVVFAVVLTVGAGTLAGMVVGTTNAAARSAAALTNGGDVRIVVPAGTDAADVPLPEDTPSSRVLRTPGTMGGTALEVVAADAASLSAVLPRDAGLDAGPLGDELLTAIPAPEPALDLQPSARQVRLQLTTGPLGEPAAGPASALRVGVAAWLEREDGTLRRIPAGTLSLAADQTQQHSLSFSIPEGLRAEAIAALDFVVTPSGGSSMPASAGFSLTLVRSSSDAGIGSGESRFAAASGLAVVPSLPGTVEAGVADPEDGAGFSVATLPDGPLTVRLATRATRSPVPVAVTSSIGAQEGDALELVVGDTALAAVVASVHPALPGVTGGTGALADLRTASHALLVTENGPAEPSEYWVPAADAESIAASLGASVPEGSVVTTAAVDPLGAPLAPLAWLILVLCLLAALTVILPAPLAGASGPRSAEDPRPRAARGPTASATRRWTVVPLALGSVVPGLVLGGVGALAAFGTVQGAGTLPVGRGILPLLSPDPAILSATFLGGVVLVVVGFLGGGTAAGRSDRHDRQGDPQGSDSPAGTPPTMHATST
ncbi:hypothetical protein V6S67_13185 [Arthrobacter sp. Soc17.1.1.1]|uniref:hypothetical protein n=1 Tax=Arthrobacter sp. Soc17.1.1.1 TaxID=3121277 RepID=UPI002FE4A4F9